MPAQSAASRLIGLNSTGHAAAGEPIAIGLLPHDLTRGSPGISRDSGVGYDMEPVRS